MFTQGLYYKFGRSVFIISLIRQLLAALLIGIALIFIQAFLPIGSIIAYILIGLFLYVLAVVTSVWYQYVYHQFKLDEYALVIRSGVLNRREISIPYRQIQDVDMNTNYLEHIFGVSELFILTSATRDSDKDTVEESKKEQSSAVFPLISHEYALELQRELMKRASVQQVSEQPGPSL